MRGGPRGARIVLLAALIALSGCAEAEMTVVRSPASPYAPVNEKHGGTVKYLNEGPQTVLDARERDAYKKMEAECRGRYKVISERTERTTPSYLEETAPRMSNTSELKVIDFECTQDDGDFN